MESKYVLIIAVVALGPVIHYLLLLFILPKCSVMSTYNFIMRKKCKHLMLKKYMDLSSEAHTDDPLSTEPPLPSPLPLT